ncbi:MAG: peptidylprolyl isomerase [Candidatus Aminicenantes bacterium]|nr:peptidylprolyl isomerase [Candidatus Aminicenantes bacterium]
MAQAKNGDKIKVHYTGKFEDGTVFDTSEERGPLEFTIGEGEVIPGFEKSIVGMEVDEKKTVTISPEEAYGPRREELIWERKKSEFPEGITPAVGKQVGVRLNQPDAPLINAIITDVSEDTVTLDANHPLAGKTLVFDIELVGIT